MSRPGFVLDLPLSNRGLLRRRHLALAFLAGVAILSFSLLLDRVILSGDAEAHGTTVVGIDMVPDDDGDTVADNTGTTLGVIDGCVQIAGTMDATFDIDTFIAAVPSDENLDAFNYQLYFGGTDNDGDSNVDEDPPGGYDQDGDTQVDEDGPDNPPPAQLTAYDNSIIINASDLSEGVPDKTSPHNEAVALGNTLVAPGGTAGALARYTFTTGIDTDADTTVHPPPPAGPAGRAAAALRLFFCPLGPLGGGRRAGQLPGHRCQRLGPLRPGQD